MAPRYYSNLRRQTAAAGSTGAYGELSPAGEAALEQISQIVGGNIREAEKWFRAECAVSGCAVYALHSGLNHSCEASVEVAAIWGGHV